MQKKQFENIKLLYVEDEENIRKTAISYFSRLFGVVYEAKDAFEALDFVVNRNPDIIITDIKMPKMSGLDFVKKVREFNKEVQIIVLTAFTDTNYLLQAVELGLVKYLIKPIRHDKILPVLNQCVKNLTQKESNLKFISINCVYDFFNRTLTNDNKIVKLTKNELEFLELLCNKLDNVVSYKEIENRIWYDSVMSENAIRSLVRNLRRKLPKNTLINVAKIGYKIESIK